MSVTFGFYNSKEGDRRYDAIQMSSIFDGIIQDGILQHVGTAMVVKESEAMIINVGVGRAWFNHTWTLNDALLPLVVPQSEILLNRYDGNTAASLAKKLLELQEQVDILNQFSSNLENEYTVYQKLYDNGYRTYGDVLDSSDAPITDSNLDTVIGRTYSSDLLRDSNGDVIEGRAIFVIK